MKEIEISLKSLLFYILKHWKSVVAGALVGAILLGVFAMYKNSSASSNVGDSSAESGLLLSDDEKAYVEAYKISVDEMRENEKRLSESLWLRFDPENTVTRELSYIVSTDDQDNIGAISSTYRGFLKSYEFAEYVSEETDFTAEEVLKLVKVSDITTSEEALSSSLFITIIADNLDNSEKISNSVKSYLADKMSEMNKNEYPNTLTLVNESKYEGVNSVVLANRIDVINTIRDTRKNIISSDAGIDQKYMDYYLSLQSVDDADLEEEITQSDDVNLATHKPISKRQLIKYIIVGLLVGFILVSMFHMAVYIISNRLDEDDDVENLFGVYLYGIIPGDDYGKFLYKLGHLGKRNFNAEESCKLIVSKIKLTSEKDNIGKYIIMGCDIKKHSEKSTDILLKYLEDAGIETLVIDNPLYDPVSVRNLEASTHVILLEKVGETIRTEIWNELEMVKKLGIIVDGLVISE